MRPYIILNGISSKSIPGLLIQSLPPIVKPKIRTNIEEIDGRDGDIVTELGYEAYDLECSIGLYGKFDIDQVMRFFNSSGEVVFSSQPDRFQKYSILDQIDFEKLIRFKTATVKLHVQPFKYWYGEQVTTFDGLNSSSNSCIVYNQGNVIARPLMTIHGTGTIGVYLNTVQILKIELDAEDADFVTINLEESNAYKESTLKNRIVTGNYDSFYLNPSEKSTISFSGDVTKLEIERFTRWV